MSDTLAHSILEAAKIAGIGRSFVYQEIRAGRLVARKAGGRTLILHSDLLDYLRRLPTQQAAGDAPESEPAAARHDDIDARVATKARQRADVDADGNDEDDAEDEAA